MFEQQSYDYGAPEVRTEPGDPFHNYEIKGWKFTPRLYKIFAASAVFNLVALFTVGQAELLTRRGCDSPFVGRVCQVLDTVYVGSIIFGSEREYADVDYTRTQLEPGDEVTFIDVSGVEPPLDYPSGYFALANPEQQFANVTDPMVGSGFIAPGIPANPTMGGSGLINTPPITPQVNPNPVDGSLPTDSPLGGVTDNPTVPRSRKGRRGGQLSGANTDANTNTAAKDTNTNTANPTVAENPEEAAKEDQNGVFINKRPLKDKTNETLAQVDAGAVQLDKSFRVVITGTLGYAKDGRTVILKNAKVVPIDKNFPADPALTKLAQEWVVAVGDAGWYGYLGVMDDKKGVGKKVTVTLEQNDTTFVANLKSEQPTPERANTAASSLYNMMTIGALAADGDELIFLKATKTATDGKFLVVNFELPKSQVQEMITRKLTEEKAKSEKPESNAVIKSNDNSAKK